jgi:hypothetical protein
MKPLEWSFLAAFAMLILAGSSSAYAGSDKVVVAGAEEKVLQRALRRAVEEAGIYLEAAFHDFEKESQGRSTHTTSLEIRTVAAAITETEILESRRSFENDRPVFFLRIRATVDLLNSPKQFDGCNPKRNSLSIFGNSNKRISNCAHSSENSSNSRSESGCW